MYLVRRVILIGVMLEQVQRFAAGWPTEIFRCVIPRQLVEIGVTRIRTRHQHGAEAAVDRMARIERQRTVVLWLHVTGMNVSVLRGRRRRRSLSLHRRLHALLFALRVLALSEILWFFLLRLMLRTGRWRL